MPELKIEELTLGAEFDGLPVHLLVRESNPVTKPRTVAQVGFYQQATDVQDMWDVGGSASAAQAVIDKDVVPAVREYLQVAPPLPEVEAVAEVPAAKPLTAAQVKAANARGKAKPESRPPAA